MPPEDLGILRFEAAFFERVWGGRKLETELGMTLPPEKPIGEAWLISDHPHHESVVAEGPHAGQTLRQLLASHGEALLGAQAKPTPSGRFPLLLKVLDSREWLSVQVHPDDACAVELGEPDVGKTEMWHILEAESGSELISGLLPGIDESSLRERLTSGTVLEALERFRVSRGDSLHVEAGTVHAIGPGILLAEIQQNSDITYRLYDWGRTGSDGSARELHIERGLRATKIRETYPRPTRGLSYPIPGGQSTVLSACEYFAAERVEVRGTGQRDVSGSFHILYCVEGEISIECETYSTTLGIGGTLLVSSSAKHICFTGSGSFLDYYVPDIAKDVVAPLLDAGHSAETVETLLG